jgi:hypothetical protein
MLFFDVCKISLAKRNIKLTPYETFYSSSRQTVCCVGRPHGLGLLFASVIFGSLLHFCIMGSLDLRPTLAHMILSNCGSSLEQASFLFLLLSQKELFIYFIFDFFQQLQSTISYILQIDYSIQRMSDLNRDPLLDDGESAELEQEKDEMR